MANCARCGAEGGFPPFTCPKCGHDVSNLITDAARFAYFKRTAPVEDVRFALRVGVHLGDLETEWRMLLAKAEVGMERTAVYRELTSLQDRWRRASSEADRAAGTGTFKAREAGVP